MKVTTDYDIFKKHENNRDLDQGALKKLRSSIQAKNMLHLRPIVVDEDMYVIDGQHRLFVAKELGLKVYYIIQENSSKHDIILLNNAQKKWGQSDYLNFYIAEGLVDYINLKDFMDKKGLQLQAALALLGYTHSRSNQLFRNGKFKFNITEDINVRYLFYRDFLEYFTPKLLISAAFLSNATFIVAFFSFFNDIQVSYDVFKKKMEQKIHALHSCGKKQEYLDLFTAIYNYKNQNPIDIRKVPSTFLSLPIEKND